MKGVFCLMKRFLDVLLSLLAIIFLSPLMLIICLIIICDDGLPVIFRQNRVSKGDELFKIKKFRTLCLIKRTYTRVILCFLRK